MNTQLWNVVRQAVGGDGPQYWYYGHIHNGVVYTETSVAGKVKARLVGHGAIPFGRAWSLPPRKAGGFIDYFADTPVAPGSVPVQNGFAMLELTAAGGITERLYEHSGTRGQPKLAWSSR